MNEVLEIPFNKTKMLPNLFGALVFVVFGFLFIIFGVRLDQLLAKVGLLLVGLSSVLFFGLILATLLAKIFKDDAGLIISDEGMTDNTSGVSAGFIPWKEIRKINYATTGNQKSLVIMTSNPEKFIKRVSNPLKRLAMRMNYKISGSPIHVQVGFLDMDLNALNQIIADRRHQRKASR